MKSALNRRGLFALLGRPLQRTMKPPKEGAAPQHPEVAASNELDNFVLHMQHAVVPTVRGEVAATEAVAVIQGRRCIALTSFCAVCIERCPVPGAMQVTQGMPSVVPDVCTGCGICHQVCPAPANAILMLPRRRTPRPSTTTTATP